MRIAALHNLPSGGARRALIAHCRGLRALGHEVEVFCPGTSDERFQPFGDAAGRIHVFDLPRPPGREASLFGKPGPLTAARAVNLLRALHRVHRAMARAVDGGGFDVVLAGHDQFTHAPLALRWLRTPSAYYCQEPLRFVYDAPVGLDTAPPGAAARLLRRTATAAARRLLRPLDAGATAAARVLLANSIFSHESIMRAYGRPARVIYLGVDTGLFRPLGLPRERVVLSVGAMHPAKGFDFLVRALGRLPAADRPPLVLISDRGYGLYRDALLAEAARAGVRLELLERVSDEELVRWYNRAAVVGYAPYLEPFGFVPLEAAACQAPVVGVAEGGVRESVRDGETGLLAPRDEEAFAAAVSRLLEDPALGARLGAAGRENARLNWTWDGSCRALEQALADCARAGRRA